MKLQGACSGQVDRRALRATGLGNRHSQGHTIKEMETGPAKSLCCDALHLSVALSFIYRRYNSTIHIRTKQVESRDTFLRILNKTTKEYVV